MASKATESRKPRKPIESEEPEPSGSRTKAKFSPRPGPDGGGFKNPAAENSATERFSMASIALYTSIYNALETVGFV